MRGLRSQKFWLSLQTWFIRLQGFVRSIQFIFQKIFYKLREVITKAIDDIHIFVVLVKTVSFSILFALITILIIYFLSPYVGYVNISNVESYDNLLIAVASITGIFLSLYFTGLNTVIGSLYAKSPHPVRNLFIQERIGSFSVNFIIWLTLVSLGSLVLGVTWDVRSKLTVIVIVVSGCFSILFFAQLGKRAFYFFDPTGFSPQLLSELARWSRQASSNGVLFANPAFQFYYHRKGNIVLDSFIGLNKVALSENHLKEEALSYLISSVISTYSRYLYTKKSIPTKSRWFPYKNKYKDWYLPSDYYIHIAATAKAELFPASEPDHYWLENGFENIEVSALKASVNSDFPSTTSKILADVFSQFTELGRSGEIQQALLFHSKIELSIRATLENNLPTIAELQVDQNDAIQTIGILEVLCSYLVTLVAGFFSSFDSLDPSSFSIKIERQNWTRSDSPYALGLPFSILPDIEDISAKLIFEHQVEGKFITPDWYISELIARKISLYLVETMSSLLTKGIKFFLYWIKAFEENHQTIKTIVVIDRGMEFSEKLKTMAISGNQLIRNLYKLKSIDLTWGTWNHDDKLSEIEQFNKELITRLASHLPELSGLKRTDNIPDYFGKSLVIIGDECFRSLDSNEQMYFEAIFQKYFIGCLLIYENLRKTTEDRNLHDRFIALSEPLMDLFDMSGYSLLYSEFHQNPELWKICMSVWDDYFNVEDSEGLLQTMGALYNYRQDSFVNTERENIRTQWKMKFLHRLRLLPKKHIEEVGFLGGCTVPDHPSEIISVVADCGEIMMPSYNPDEIFIDLYIKKQAVAKDIDFRLRYPITEMISCNHNRKPSK
ncbi:MAG: hypothetical protein HPY85_17155 [Anaerolineae bacterium]|nr:hypothetical protein [Anaerolineae bacterium]